MLEKFRRVVKSILTAEDEPSPCPFSVSLPAYVDAELEGKPVEELYLEIADHLDECLDCFEEYSDLRWILEAEQKGELEKPPREGEFDFGFLERPEESKG